jgi:hypothetical protein
MDMMDRSHVQFKDSQIGSVGSCHYVLPIMVVISSRIGQSVSHGPASACVGLILEFTGDHVTPPLHSTRVAGM